jgi:hypothetical protein
MKNFVKPLELKQRLDESLGLNQSPMLSSRQMDWNGILVEQCKHSSVVDIAWSIAANNDLRITQMAGAGSPMVRFLNWYMSKLHVAARTDRVVAIAFL